MNDEIRVEQQIPVFMPGQNRDWIPVLAKCIIASDGTIVIKCLNPEDGERIVDLVKEGILYQCSFDYRMSLETLEKINHQYQKKE